MTADTYMESIAHLDFDIEEKKGEPCDGWHGTTEEKTFGNNKNCPNQAKVYGIRSCCGQIKVMCLECYNALMAFHSGLSECWHTGESMPSHLITGSVFSRIEFI